MPLQDEPTSGRVCEFEACGKKHYGKRLCRPHYRRAYYLANKDRERAYNQAWRERNPERDREYSRRSRERNPDADRAYYAKTRDARVAYTREWHKRNPDYSRRYRAENPDALREWRGRNPERTFLYKSQRRARQASPLRFSPEQLAQRIAYYGGKCWICRIAPYEHLDHVKPLSKGGGHLLANLRPACAACNVRKNARWPFVNGAIDANR